MEHTDLGPLSVSRVGLGCNNFGGRLDLAATRRVVDAALDAGVTFFDTADIYGNRGGSERLLGELLQGRRDRVVLATKFGGEMGDGAVGGAPAYVVQAARGVAAASADRPRRPALPPLPGRRHAHRRHRGRDVRAGGGRQGAGDRRLQRDRRPAGGGGRHRRDRRGAERVLAARPGGGARTAARLPGARGRLRAVLPAGIRLSDRQVPRRGGRRGVRGWGRSRRARPSRAVPRRRSPRSSGCSASPKTRATPCWSWR